MSMKYSVITIGREFCTGGLDIARNVAGRLGAPMYDKELITLAAKEAACRNRPLPPAKSGPAAVCSITSTPWAAICP